MRQITLLSGTTFNGALDNANFTAADGTIIDLIGNSDYISGTSGTGSHTVTIGAGSNDTVDMWSTWGTNTVTLASNGSPNDGLNNVAFGGSGDDTIRLTGQTNAYVNTGDAGPNGNLVQETGLNNVGNVFSGGEFGKDTFVIEGRGDMVYTNGGQNIVFIGPNALNTTVYAGDSIYGGNTTLMLMPGADPNLDVTVEGGTLTTIDFTKAFDPAILAAAFGLNTQPAGGEKGMMAGDSTPVNLTGMGGAGTPNTNTTPVASATVKGGQAAGATTSTTMPIAVGGAYSGLPAPVAAMTATISRNCGGGPDGGCF